MDSRIPNLRVNRKMSVRSRSGKKHGKQSKHALKACFTGVWIGVVVVIGLILLYDYEGTDAARRFQIPASNHTYIIASSNNQLDEKIRRLSPHFLSAKTSKRVPDFIIIGVKKGGTRALIEMLSSHPQIVSAKKEAHFFDTMKYKTKGMKWYINQMPLARDDQLVVEKTPTYFVTSMAPLRMIKSLPRTLKLILIVRNPVSRTVSDYTQMDAQRDPKKPKIPFEKYAFSSTANGGIVPKTSTGVISASLYDVHYKRWLRYFKPRQFLIVDGDQVISNPLGELKRVEKFLKVKSYFTLDKLYFNEIKGFYCWKRQNNSTQCLGSTKGRPHPEISIRAEKKLVNFFRPHMIQFCKMAHINFSLCHL